MMPASYTVKFLPPSLRRKINQFNSLHGDEPNEPPREWNIQAPAAYFKSRTSPSKTNPTVSAIMGRLNHHDIDNSDVKVTTSEFPVESNSESFPDPYRNRQYQYSHIQEYCCPNCLRNFKTNSLSNYLSAFWSCFYHQTKTNGKKSTHGRSLRKSP